MAARTIHRRPRPDEDGNHPHIECSTEAAVHLGSHFDLIVKYLALAQTAPDRAVPLSQFTPAAQKILFAPIKDPVTVKPVAQTTNKSITKPFDDNATAEVEETDSGYDSDPAGGADLPKPFLFFTPEDVKNFKTVRHARFLAKRFTVKIVETDESRVITGTVAFATPEVDLVRIVKTNLAAKSKTKKLAAETTMSQMIRPEARVASTDVETAHIQSATPDRLSDSTPSSTPSPTFDSVMAKQADLEISPPSSEDLSPRKKPAHALNPTSPIFVHQTYGFNNRNAASFLSLGSNVVDALQAAGYLSSSYLSTKILGSTTTITKQDHSFANTSHIAQQKYPLAEKQIDWARMPVYNVPFLGGTDEIVPRYMAHQASKRFYLDYKLRFLREKDLSMKCDPEASPAVREPIHIFVDLSNIMIGFHDRLKMNRGISTYTRMKAAAFDFQGFHNLLVRSRKVAKQIVAGSMRKHVSVRPAHMLEAQALGYEMNILLRVPKPQGQFSSPQKQSVTENGGEATGPHKNGEQGVDELLHLKMLQSGFDTKEPGIIVLATGDAAQAEYSDGFKKNVERLLEKGWFVELYGWSHNMSAAWKDRKFSACWGNRFRLIELDEFSEELHGHWIESQE